MSSNSVPSPDSSAGGQQEYARPYRSRKDRPCDLCRRRKGRCVIEEAGKPCQACTLINQQCTFEMQPTPRSRPSRNVIDEAVGDASAALSSSNAKLERARSQSGPHPQAHQQQQAQTQNVRFVGQPHTPNDMAAHQRAHSMQHAQRYQPYPSPQDMAGPSGYAAGHPGNYAPQPQQLPQQQQQHQFQGPDRQQYAPRSEPKAPARPAAARRISKKAAASRGGVASAGVRGHASINQLHDLVAAMIQGEEPFSDTGSDSAGEELRQPQSATDEQGTGLTVTPFVLGSSSSEDPVLLGQAASPSTEVNGGASARGRATSVSRTTSMAGGAGTSDGTVPPGSAAGPGLSHVRQVTRDPRKPVFFSFMVSNPYGAVPGRNGKEIGAEGLAKLRNDLGDKAASLMVLYSQRDSAAFPLLMTSQRHKFRLAAAAGVEKLKAGGTLNGGRDAEIPLPPVLATATLATGIIYDPALRPISKSAWGSNLHALIEQFDLSSLVTLQVACTDLTGRPSINTSGNMMSLMQTIAIAHMLGMHLDPSTWTLPREERDVRIRLWWAIVIHDKWSSLCWGRPSVIHKQDFSTPLPRRDGLSPCREHLADANLSNFSFGAGYKIKAGVDAHTPGDTFASLCSLTMLLDDILLEFHGFTHSCQTARRDGYSVASRVRSHMLALTDWRESLPGTLRALFAGDEKGAAGTEIVPGTRSLQLCYFGVLLLLCRTALDGVTASESFDEARVMPAHRTALHAAHMVVNWLDALGSDEYRDSFFLYYGSHHLASCLSLLARLALGFSRMGETEDLAASIEALRRFLTLLADAKKKHMWDLAELAITRSLVILPQLALRIPDFPSLLDVVAPAAPTPATNSGTPNAGPSMAPSGSVPTDALQSIGGKLFDESSAMLSGMPRLDGHNPQQPILSFGHAQPSFHGYTMHDPQQQHQAMQMMQQQAQQQQHGAHAMWNSNSHSALMMPPTGADPYATYGASAGPALLLADDWMQLGIGPSTGGGGSDWLPGV